MDVVHFFFDSFWSANYWMLVFLCLCFGGYWK